MYSGEKARHRALYHSQMTYAQTMSERGGGDPGPPILHFRVRMCITCVCLPGLVCSLGYLVLSTGQVTLLVSGGVLGGGGGVPLPCPSALCLCNT